jgi:hypothetical protein
MSWTLSGAAVMAQCSMIFVLVLFDCSRGTTGNQNCCLNCLCHRAEHGKILQKFAYKNSNYLGKNGIKIEDMLGQSLQGVYTRKKQGLNNLVTLPFKAHDIGYILQLLHYI